MAAWPSRSERRGAAAARELFESVDYRGLGYVEIKRDTRSDMYAIIEANIGRPTGHSAIAERGGVELLFTAYADAVGLPLPSAREQRYAASSGSTGGRTSRPPRCAGGRAG